MAKLPPNPLQSEILRAVSNAKTKATKIKLLQEYRCHALISLLIWNFDESISSALPDGEVPYTPNDAPTPDAQSKLMSEYRTLYNFVKGVMIVFSGQGERTFIELLESLHPDEAELLCLVKDKDLGKKYKVTYNTVK